MVSSAGRPLLAWYGLSKTKRSEGRDLTLIGPRRDGSIEMRLSPELTL